MFGQPSRTPFDGSSPRLRGTQPVIPARPGIGRFIPAPAGNTRSPRRCKTSATVHPRACGEHLQDHAPLALGIGSSPRLRGTRLRDPLGRRHVRFIPAPAGNTYGPSGGSARPSVHPRACGEHGRPGARRILESGSSPRLRGTQRGDLDDGELRRFIPAPAGNTLSLTTIRCR
ncbi:hypothetical protein HMPREF0731_3077 [Pseudoroseomonas cervicalis ATCC 49957]|nr:hypothetical protein HMPREF0731_3077 [Pseudoroseomonas cervicalis ATCC 49957]